MARLYAQLFTLVFAVVGLGGLALGDAGHTGGGNLGGLTLHLTWARDILDIAIAAALALVGFTFRIPRQPAAILVVLIGALLFVLAVSGFIVGDDALATKGFAGLHFPTAVNVLDLLSGVLGLFSGGLTLADQPEAA
ncbi:MAG TPA: hypothetical protein VMU20_20175 [Candidatus Dormibacteraeota bacterium]|jgi:hypothetical protein|nr:hypothetical protein [Candidatus Dormibacteraeota bacterium]